MYIVIAESGNLAQELVASFIASGDEVYILDTNEKLVKKIQADFGMVASLGDMMSIDDLTEAGVSRASIFIAGSENDYNNLAACQLVKNTLKLQKPLAYITTWITAKFLTNLT